MGKIGTERKVMKSKQSGNLSLLTGMETFYWVLGLKKKNSGFSL
jgi:hypothetical protein